MGDGGVAWAGPGLAVIPQTNFLSEIHSRQIDEMSGAHLSNDAVIEAYITVGNILTNWGFSFLSD